MKARDVKNGTKVNAFGFKGKATSVSRDKVHTYFTVNGTTIRLKNGSKAK